MSGEERALISKLGGLDWIGERPDPATNLISNF